MGTNGGGLNRFDPDTETFTAYRHRQGDASSLSHDGVYSLHQGRDGTLWVGTANGLNQLQEDATADPASISFTRYTDETTNFDGSAVMSILEDEKGMLWLSLLSGKLARFNPETGHVRLFGTRAGIDVGGFFEGAVRTREGTMYFGGTRGMIAFDPARIQENTQPPGLVLSELWLVNQVVEPGPEAPLQAPLSETTEVVLTHRQNDLSIGFVGLHYADPSGNRYNYRLVNYDLDWRGVTEQRRATYTSLRPGSYTFEVKAANRDGVWTEEPVRLSVVILPPWWRTWWAYLSYGLLLVTTIFTADRFQRRRLLNKERQRVAAERTEEIRLQNERLSEIDEMKSRFLANISHEFRTPLTLTFGPLQDFLDRRFPSYEEAKPHFERALRNGRLLLQLFNQLLDLSRIESGTLKLQVRQHDLNRFLSQVIALFESLADSRGMTLHMGSPPGPFLHGFDADMLENALVNLLANAFKFTPDGGTITVHLHREANGQACIEVGDTGAGIAADHLAFLFDRFYQVDATTTREGAGIGLALAKELVALHGGMITVESEVGVGTRFTIHLPDVPIEAEGLEQQEQAAVHQATAGRLSVAEIEMGLVAAEAPQASKAVSAEATIVLLVEDNADMRDYLRGHLKDDFEVVEAEDGKQGLARAYELVPDLVLSDVMMPEMDGLALCKALKQDERTSHIPVVLLTAKADVETRISGFETGADAYFPKPFNAEELNVRVRSLIEQRRALRTKFSRSGEAITITEVSLPSQEVAFLEQVQQVVEERLSDTSFGVDGLAEEVGMSQRQLLRKLRALTGETSHEMIWRLRLERAADLLRQKAASVKEVAYAVGFKYEASFSRSFRKVYGVSPSEYADQEEQEQAPPVRPGS